MDDDGEILSADQRRLLETLLEVVIPPSPDGRLPGAGGLGLTDTIVRTVRQMPMIRPVLEYGFGALAELAIRRNPDGWTALTPAERTAVFAELTATDQFFLPAFLFLAYSSYYLARPVVEALGLEARAPHPKGYPMEADDLTLLDAVRRRGRMYRD
jgi:hypothetical protein